MRVRTAAAIACLVWVACLPRVHADPPAQTTKGFTREVGVRVKGWPEDKVVEYVLSIKVPPDYAVVSQPTSSFASDVGQSGRWDAEVLQSASGWKLIQLDATFSEPIVLHDYMLRFFVTTPTPFEDPDRIAVSQAVVMLANGLPSNKFSWEILIQRAGEDGYEPLP